jgi:hypothetical protein
MWNSWYFRGGVLAIIPILAIAAEPGRFQLQPAEPVTIPLSIDSNSPTFWIGDDLHAFSSTGAPYLSSIGEEIRTHKVEIDSTNFPMWIESVWQADDGTVYAWYHHEQVGLCPGTTLHVPVIGALVSYDAGKSFKDLGIILSSGEPNDCSARNGYFANGHGDFSVILDREKQFFYFVFGVYGGEASRQGIAIARMAFTNLTAPVGTVWKYHAGSWNEPGLRGHVTPVFPATVGWQAEDTDAFWGPSIHWNTHLENYVVVMNRSCCHTGWPQEGIYLTMTADLSDPAAWSAPVKVLATGDWYPWVLGIGPGETSAEAGKTVRLFVRNFSEWQITFERADEQEPPSDADPPPSDETGPPSDADPPPTDETGPPPPEGPPVEID